MKNLLSQIERIKNEWQDTIDCIKQMVVLIDISDKIVRCNNAFRLFLGRSYENIIGKNFYSTMAELGIDLKDFDLHNGADVYVEDKQMWLNIDLTPFKSSSEKQICGAVVVIDDITEVKTLTESLEIVNARIDKERLELQSALDEITFLLREVEQKGDLGVRFAIADNESEFIFRLGSNFNNMMEMLQSKNRELETAYSELKKAQAQILQREKMASIGQIAAGVAHEINNPMGFITSNLSSLGKYTAKLIDFINEQHKTLEMLASKCDKDMAVNSLDKIKQLSQKLKIDFIKEDISNLIKESLDGAERVTKIVQNLKSFARIDEVEWKLANINDCIDNAIKIIWNEIKYKITLKCDYGDIPNIYCNPGELNQVFLNMILNACQAIETKGEIEVKTWAEDRDVFVSIKDTGCGMPEDIINRIFEPFFTTKDVGKGTGLGLSISYDIIKKHDGDITVDSKLGQGTKFTIRLPIKEHR
ncbi:MAG: ATP-binding protein [Thermodesulfovibrionales bacterium]|nr:ATP-binding protein [Thermodesulfovibrionales bacterium]